MASRWISTRKLPFTIIKFMNQTEVLYMKKKEKLEECKWMKIMKQNTQWKSRHKTLLDHYSDEIKKKTDTNSDGKIDAEDVKVSWGSTAALGRGCRRRGCRVSLVDCGHYARPDRILYLTLLLTLLISWLSCSCALQTYWKKFKALMTNKIPSAGGFSFGFLYGVRYG